MSFENLAGLWDVKGSNSFRFRPAKYCDRYPKP